MGRQQSTIQGQRLALALATVGPLAVASTRLLPHRSLRLAVLYGIATAALLIAARACHRPAQPHAEGWRRLLSGIALMTSGGLVRDVTAQFTGVPPVAGQAVLALSVVAGVPLIASGLNRVLSRPASADREETRLDAGLVAVAGGIILWVALRPSLEGAAGEDLILALAVLVLGTLSVWITVRRLLAAGQPSRSEVYLLCALAGPLVSAALARGSYGLAGESWYSILNFCVYPLLAAAIVHPSSDDAEAQATSAVAPAHLALVRATLFVPAGLAMIQQLLTGKVDVWALAAASVALTLLVAKRTTLSIERAKSEHQAREAEHRRFSALMSNAADPIVAVDDIGRCTYLSPAAESVIGAAYGRSLPALADAASAESLRIALEEAIRHPGDVLTTELTLTDIKGAVRCFEVRVASHLHDEALAGIVTNWRDVTDRRKAERRLAHQAEHDSLTGLLNRRALDERLLTRLDANADIVVLYCDADGLKQVNDRLGHEAGDVLLAAVAERIRDTCRLDDLVARVGGDEFVVVASSPGGRAEGIALAERVHQAVSRPLRIGRGSVTPGMSIGVAFSDGERTASRLLSEADEAMYFAKKNGGGVSCVSSEAASEGVRAHPA